jgi:hypothetical protein
MSKTAGETLARIVGLLGRGFQLHLDGRDGGTVEVTVHDFDKHTHHQGETLHEALGKAAAAYRNRSGCEACDRERSAGQQVKIPDELHSCSGDRSAKATEKG